MARRLLTLGGVAMGLFGLAGLLRNADATAPLSWLAFVLGGLAVHDALVAPAVMTAGFVLARAVPRRYRPALQGGFVVAAALVVVALPVLSGNGRLPNNPSILPQDYGAGLLIALAVVAGATLGLVVRASRRPPAPEPPQPEPPPPWRPGW